jgi:2-dehydropantoate 2-reductase
MLMRIALMGAGSLGIILGALISAKGYCIDLIDTNEENVATLNRDGAVITGYLDLKVPVKALTPDQLEGEYDLVFYVVKAVHNRAALNTIARHLKQAGAVVTLQNGFPEEAVAAVLGRERTMGCVVIWGATWVKPGVSMLTQAPETMEYYIAEMDGSDSDRLNQACRILESAGRPIKCYNLDFMRWHKIALNATMSAVSTVIGGTFGDVLDHPKGKTCLAFLGREILHTVRCLNIPVDITLFDFNTRSEMEEKFQIFDSLWPNRSAKASMLQDLESGRPCEIDSINGALLEKSKQAGVSTPVNERVVWIINSIQDGHLGFSPDNLNLINFPELI